MSLSSTLMHGLTKVADGVWDHNFSSSLTSLISLQRELSIPPIYANIVSKWVTQYPRDIRWNHSFLAEFASIEP